MEDLRVVVAPGADFDLDPRVDVVDYGRDAVDDADRSGFEEQSAEVLFVVQVDNARLVVRDLGDSLAKELEVGDGAPERDGDITRFGLCFLVDHRQLGRIADEAHVLLREVDAYLGLEILAGFEDDILQRRHRAHCADLATTPGTSRAQVE